MVGLVLSCHAGIDVFRIRIKYHAKGEKSRRTIGPQRKTGEQLCVYLENTFKKVSKAA
jgi:hypothetical protein